MANEIVMQVVIETIEVKRSGTSQNGPWAAQSYVAKTVGHDVNYVRFDVFGEDRIGRLNIQQGKVYNIWLSVYSSQYVGRDGVTRWNNNIRCYDARPVEG